MTALFARPLGALALPPMLAWPLGPRTLLVICGRSDCRADSPRPHVHHSGQVQVRRGSAAPRCSLLPAAAATARQVRGGKNS